MRGSENIPLAPVSNMEPPFGMGTINSIFADVFRV
jgi:hypothetical protein